MRTRKEILKEREDVVEEYQKLQGRADPEATKKRGELAAQAHKLDDELDKTDDVVAASEAAEKPSRKNRLAVVVFITVILVSCGLIYWALWSALERGRANNYAAQLTRAWNDVADVRATLKEREKLLKAAEVMIKELEAAVAPVPSAPAAATALVPATPTVTITPAKDITEAMKLAVVGKGEGIEHALIRQLLAFPKTFGFEGNPADPKAIRKWAEKMAHRIALSAGYVNASDGSEVRVRNAGEVAYVLAIVNNKTFVSDITAEVRESVRGKDRQFLFDPAQMKIQQFDPLNYRGPSDFSVGVAKFKAGVTKGEKGCLQAYEYFWTPEMRGEPVPMPRA